MSKLYTSVAKKIRAAIADARRAGDGESGPRGELVADLERIAGVYEDLGRAAPAAVPEPAAQVAEPPAAAESSPAPKVAEEPKPARCRCKGTTKAGERCKGQTADPSGYCRKHVTQGEQSAGLKDTAEPGDVSRMDAGQLQAIFAGLDLATQRSLIALALESGPAKKAA